MVMLDLGGSSGWVWALFKVEPRVFAGGLDAERTGQRGYSRVLAGATGGLWLPLTGETGRGGCGPGGELSSGRGCETEKRCLEGSQGAVKFGFFGEHVVLGKMSSPGREGHQGRTCLLRGGDMSRRCSRKREEDPEEGVGAVGWARDSRGLS